MTDTDFVRLDLRMDDEGAVFLRVMHRTPTLDFEWTGESCHLGHVTDICLVNPTLLSQLAALHEEWDEGREQRVKEREEEAQDYASMLHESWWGA